MKGNDVERIAWHVWAALVVAVAGAAFIGTAWGETAGVWPVPLDDTYIYFGCARSFAVGEPFAWYPGNGYGSGCTSVVYPILLAPFWAVGLRGSWLGVAAFALALLCLIDLARSLRIIAGEHPVCWLYPLLLVAVPLLDWSWFSGMETALLGALLGRALRSAHHTLGAPLSTRGDRQLFVGLWLAGAVLVRVEAVPFVVAMAVALGYRGGAVPLRRSLPTVAGPAFAALSVQAIANRVLTGEWAQAGAVRKALWSNPYADDAEVALGWAKNLLVLVDRALVTGVGGSLLALAVPVAALLALAFRRHRPLAAVAWSGALGALAVVCVNSTATYQNYRYAAPVLLLLVLAACLGLHALAERAPWPVTAALGAVAVLAPASQARRQVAHFARASANIVEQHVEVARRVRQLSPPPRRILVNDAGAIPYLADVRPIDGFGLGGFRGLPFARASVHGHPAVVELIERLHPGDRPDVMVLYPNWWSDVARRFGRPIDAVRIDDNVICGHDEKVIYAADWRALADPSERLDAAVDVLDVADLVSERAHDFAFPAPHGGWVVGAERFFGRKRRYDAGRVIPPGRQASFRVASTVADGGATLRLRTRAPAAVRLSVWRDGARVEDALATAAPARPEHWTRLEAKLQHVGGHDRIELESDDGFELFTVWLLR